MDNQQVGSSNEAMSVGQWILTILVGIIPCVGLIMYIVWAVSSNGNSNRKNYCIASLIVSTILVVITIVMYVAFFAVIIAALGMEGLI